MNSHWHIFALVLFIGYLGGVEEAVDKGTLFQLRNLINRRNVVSDVSKDTAA